MQNPLINSDTATALFEVDRQDSNSPAYAPINTAKQEREDMKQTKAAVDALSVTCQFSEDGPMLNDLIGESFQVFVKQTVDHDARNFSPSDSCDKDTFLFTVR